MRPIPHTIMKATLIIGSFMIVANAHGHIKNEESQFPDIGFSSARFDIVVLVGVGIIPETPVFEPDKPLSRHDLAAWVSLARGLATGGETPDIDALAARALEARALDSLDGVATYSDINRLFFDGRLAVPEPNAVPTRGEAASFMAGALSTDAGRMLLESLGVRPAQTGTVTSVRTETNEHGGASYDITVGDVSLPMYAHGRVANGPVDLLQWKGREIRRSFVRDSGGETMWIYMEATPRTDSVPAQTDVAPADGRNDSASLDRTLLYWLIAGVVVLGIVLFFRSRRA